MNLFSKGGFQTICMTKYMEKQSPFNYLLWWLCSLTWRFNFNSCRNIHGEQSEQILNILCCLYKCLWRRVVIYCWTRMWLLKKMHFEQTVMMTMFSNLEVYLQIMQKYTWGTIWTEIATGFVSLTFQSVFSHKFNVAKNIH